MASEEIINQLAQVKGAIAALEAQRSTLGDAVVDASIAALHKQMADLEAQAHIPEQLRKLLTILFTDVVGSTQISRQFDPEELLDFMDPTLKRLAKPVEEHGGRVTRFQGDGFKAIFGLPVARENEPEMAVRAGLGILEASREIAGELEKERGIPGFQVRVGINTGLVASGGLTEGEDTIGGEAINLAARLESAAPPGGLLISHDTYRHVRGVFNVEKAEPMRAKGFPGPVASYIVHSAKPRAFRVQSRGVEGIETRMVGRQTELKILQDAFLTAIEDSEGQVVTVSGDAGVGKSRLLYEFQNWIELLPQSVRLYPARARPETQKLPYASLRDLFASRFQIQDGDPAEITRKKFSAGIAEAFGTSGYITAGEPQTHLLGQLLGFDFKDSPHLTGLLSDPRALRDRALESLVDYFSAVCRSDPAVIFLEDLHWADDSSLDAINFLARRGKDLTLLIVALARRSLLERRPHWGEGQLYHRKVQLEPLSKRESRELVEEILQKIDQVPAVLQELVVSGGEGNPFYIEELVKMLVEQGVILKGEELWSAQVDRLAQADVPATLTGVVQARLDSLPRDERSILQQASVVGRVFWDRVVEYFQIRQDSGGEEISQKLAGLRDKEMVFRREESVFSQANEYIFKHEILREVTYESVLKKLRRLYHGWVADWLVEQGDQCGEEYSGLIAEHLELAGKIEQAMKYLRRAGQAALASYANSEAAHYFRRALDLGPPETVRPALLGELAEALLRQGYRDEAFSAWREGIAIYQDQGNLEGVLRYYTAIIRTLLPDWPIEAVSECETALTFVEGLPEIPALGHFFHQVARAYYFYGNRDQAVPLSKRALEIAEQFDDFELQADVLVTISVLHFFQPEKALEILQQSVELAETNRFFYVAWRAHHNLAIVYSYLLSDHKSAIPHFYRSWEIARQYGAIDEEAAGLDKLIIESINIGDINAAENYLRELERVSQKMPQPELIADRIFDSRAQVAIVRGQLEEAYELLTKSLNGARRDGRAQDIHSTVTYSYMPVLLDMHRYLGWTDWDLAEQTLEEVIALVNHTGGIVGAGEAEALLSIVFARQGRTEEARRWLETAQALIPPDPLDFLRTLLLFTEAELAISQGSWEVAIQKTEALLQEYVRVGLRWEQAHTLLELGEIYRMRGEPGDKEKAIDLYNQAREIFIEIGASGYVEIVDGRIKMLQASKGS